MFSALPEYRGKPLAAVWEGSWSLGGKYLFVFYTEGRPVLASPALVVDQHPTYTHTLHRAEELCHHSHHSYEAGSVKQDSGDVSCLSTGLRLQAQNCAHLGIFGGNKRLALPSPAQTREGGGSCTAAFPDRRVSLYRQMSLG